VRGVHFDFQGGPLVCFFNFQQRRFSIHVCIGDEEAVGGMNTMAFPFCKAVLVLTDAFARGATIKQHDIPGIGWARRDTAGLP